MCYPEPQQVRTPAQVHVLEFKCLPLSQFHSQIPKIYIFQTWYSLSPFHSFLSLGSQCHPNANAKPTGFNTMPTALSKSCSEYQNIMTQLAYECVNDSFFKHCKYVFAKQFFFSFRLLSCSIQCSAFSTYTSLSSKSPWSSTGLTTHYAYSPKYGTQSNVPKPSASNPKY
jgi:hypothetical protein